MEHLPILTAGIVAVILFVFGLEHFSSEIQRLSSDRFRRALSRMTDIPLVGVLIGALLTAIIQSSSATSVIAISLVNAGVLSFKNSVSIIFGSNIGSTVTAQLVAFKLTAFAPWLIIIGFALTLVRLRISIFGKAIFYFGFVFFSLDLISSALAPLQQDPDFVDYLVQPQNPMLAILIGCMFTAVVQSSAVTTALAIVFTQQGLLSLENAVPLIMGANIGTTATALLAMINMDLAAKKTAFSHLLFNVGGVAIFLPVYLTFGHRLNDIEADPAVTLANVHLAFNVGTSVIFILLLSPFTRLVERLMGEGKMDFQRLTLPKYDTNTEFEKVRTGLETNAAELLAFLEENYRLATLGIESNDRKALDATERRLDYINFLQREHMAFFARVVTQVTDEQASRQLLAQITRYDYLFQVHDSIQDLFETRRAMHRQFIEPGSDVLLMVRDLSGHTLALFDAIRADMTEDDAPEIGPVAAELRGELAHVSRQLLPLLAKPDRRDAGALSSFVTYSRRLGDKLVNFANSGSP